MTAATVEAPAASDNFWAGAEVIHSYTRADMLRDGNLVDVTETAKEAGFVWPVAMSAAAHADTVAWNDGNDGNDACRDESGRLWDVLFMAVFAMKSGAKPDARNTITYDIVRIPNKKTAVAPRRVTLRAWFGPGDNMEPVVTIMLPDED
jgi:hypothetical protein